MLRFCPFPSPWSGYFFCNDQWFEVFSFRCSCACVILAAVSFSHSFGVPSSWLWSIIWFSRYFIRHTCTVFHRWHLILGLLVLFCVRRPAPWALIGLSIRSADTICVLVSQFVNPFWCMIAHSAGVSMTYALPQHEVLSLEWTLGACMWHFKSFQNKTFPNKKKTAASIECSKYGSICEALAAKVHLGTLLQTHLE